jgi:transposase
MGKKVFVVVDNLRVHHSKVIKRWLKWFCSKIEVHYLPSYTPDLNPDEYFNCDLETKLSKRPERRKKGEWENVVNNTLSDLEKQPERI